MTAATLEKQAEQARIREILKETPDPEVLNYLALYCTEGTSDKVYLLYLRRDSGGKKYRVDFSYGRRGDTLRDETMTETAVDYYTAKDLFDSQATEKMTKKGYVMEPPKFQPKPRSKAKGKK